MRPNIVEVLQPRKDDDFCLGPAREPFHAQAFVTDLAVEAFAVTILLGFAKSDQRRFNSLVRVPLENGMRDKLGAVVRPKRGRRSALGYER
jgi:hypothetical protein